MTAKEMQYNSRERSQDDGDDKGKNIVFLVADSHAQARQ